MKITKRKLARLPKYPMGGVTKTPEQIQYEEYLARNNQSVEQANAIDKQREDNVITNNKNLANADSYSQGITSTGLGVTSAIGGNVEKVGGIVGGLIGIGNAIGAPIKAKSEKLNEIQYDEQGKIIENDNTGELVNRKKAKQNAVIGFIASPSKALGYRIANKDWTGLGTDKYADNLETEAKAEYQKALELQKENQFKTDKANLDTYDLKGKQGVEYYNATGGQLKQDPTKIPITTPPPTPFKMDDYYTTLNKYQTIDPFDKNTANDVKKLVGTNVVPQIKIYQETLNKALRSKYKLAPDAPITTQYLTEEEVNASLNGKGEDYYKYFNAYQDYRDKASAIPKKNVEGTITEDPKLYGKRHVETFPVQQKALGGDLKQLASNVQIAEGDTHQEDTNNDGLKGITLTDKKGRPYAEIENKEVIVGDKVYSERSGHAMVAEKLGEEKGKYEAFLHSNNTIQKNTAKRNVEKIDMKLAKVYEHQQMMKQVNGMNDNGTKKALGGGLGDSTSYIQYDENGNPITAEMQYGNQGNPIVNGMQTMEANDTTLANFKTPQTTSTTPTTFDETGKSKRANVDYGKLLDVGFNAARFADNIYNANLTKNTPQIPRPRLEQASTLDTTVNIDNALNESQTDFSNFGKNVDANMSNGNTGMANKQAALVNKIKTNNQLFENKANTETQLRNQKKGENAGVAVRNNARLDQYDLNKYNRDLMIKGEKSANMANAVEDIGNIGTERNQRKLDNSRISHIQKLYDNNDAAANANYEDFYKSATTEEKDALKATLSKSASGKKKWNEDSRNKNNLIP